MWRFAVLIALGLSLVLFIHPSTPLILPSGALAYPAPASTPTDEPYPPTLPVPTQPTPPPGATPPPDMTPPVRPLPPEPIYLPIVVQPDT